MDESRKPELCNGQKHFAFIVVWGICLVVGSSFYLHRHELFPIGKLRVSISEGDEQLRTRQLTSEETVNDDAKSFVRSDDEEIDVDEENLGRLFREWPIDVPFPCFEEEKRWNLQRTQRSPSQEGILFTREEKTGSTTLASVLLRLVHRKGREMLQNQSPCKHRVDHSPARDMGYAERDKQRSYLISLLREPTKRAISSFFYFRVSRRVVAPTDRNFQRHLENVEEARSNYYTKDLSFRELDLEQEDPIELIREIMSEYDFIAVTERMDESLVVLKNLLHLDFNDILYFSGKTSSTFNALPTENGRVECNSIIPTFVTPGMEEYFESDYWKDYVFFDNLLYKAANRSLDLTIDQLGRSKIMDEVQTLRAMVENAHKTCKGRTNNRCDDAGNFVGFSGSTCMLWDLGCGHECLDELRDSESTQ